MNRFQVSGNIQYACGNSAQAPSNCHQRLIATNSVITGNNLIGASQMPGVTSYQVLPNIQQPAVSSIEIAANKNQAAANEQVSLIKNHVSDISLLLKVISYGDVWQIIYFSDMK